MPASPRSYNHQYYMNAAHNSSSYSTQPITLHHPHEHPMSHHQLPVSDSQSIPIDPALALYHPPPPSYYAYHQQPQQHISGQHLSLPNDLSSPSSQGSDTLGTPPIEPMSFPAAPNLNGKRPVSALGNTPDSRKKARNDDDGEAHSPGTEKGDEPKAKPTRGSRACTVCRRLKMKCVGAEQGPPCKRCQTGGHECIFEESNRGKRSTKKHEILTRSLRKMEKTLDTVLRSLGNPSIASGMVSRSPSPSPQNQGTQALLASPSPPHSPHGSSSNRPFPSSPKLHSLPDNTLNPLGLLAEASLANRRAQAASKSELSSASLANAEQKLGVASEVYFKPGPMTILPLRRLFIERQVQPEMLSFTTTEEVVALFKIYYEKMNFHCNVLDPGFHTPSLVCSRSPFLLTTICAIASRFYTENPELQPKLSDLTRKLAFSTPAQGYKSVEIVQAYLLATLWGCGPVERYEQDRTWLLLGMAIRMATDLNLHRRTAVTSPDTAEGRARDREVHNRERTWIFCFCLDRSFSAQMGKPYTIKEDFVIRNASQWCRAAESVPADVSLAAYADLQRILTRSLDLLYSGTNTASGLQLDSDYLLVITTMETQILAWQHEWTNIRQVGRDEPQPIQKYRELIGKFYFNYAMLIVNSFGLQNALERSAVDIGHFFARCHSSAVACCTVIKEGLGPEGYLRYAPDSNFVQASYAVLSLLKLLRPEFHVFLDHEQKTISMVKDVADALDDAAVGAMHTPALYSCLLRALLSAKTEPSPQESTSHDVGEEQAPGINGHASSHDSLDTLMQPPSSSTHPAGAVAHEAPSGASHHSPTSSSSMGPPPQPSSSSSSNHNLMTSPTLSYLHHLSSHDPLSEFHFDGEMGPVMDMSTFPPTMAPPNSNHHDHFGSVGGTGGMLSMDSILSTSFWDNVLVPGYSGSLEGLSGGFVYGAGGSGLITPRMGISPIHSGANTPTKRHHHHHEHEAVIDQHKIDAAFVEHDHGGPMTATQVAADTINVVGS